MTRKWPAYAVDHRNLDKGDNRWDNLREATRSQNMANTSLPSTNTSGFKGVIWSKRYKYWYLKAVEYSGEFVRAA